MHEPDGGNPKLVPVQEREADTRGTETGRSTLGSGNWETIKQPSMRQSWPYEGISEPLKTVGEL